MTNFRPKRFNNNMKYYKTTEENKSEKHKIMYFR